MKKFALGFWHTDNEGGWCVCYRKDFKLDAILTEFVCGFDTAEEAADFIYDPDNEYYACYTKEEIIEEIQTMVHDFLIRQED